MDQIQHDRQKIIEKLVKIKALAERGIGGEQQTAQVMYATLKEKYKVTDAEIEKAAAVPVDISEIDLKKFWGIAFQLAAVAKTLQEETDICTACRNKYDIVTGETEEMAQELRDIADVLKITEGTDTNIRKSMESILRIADRLERTSNGKKRR